MAELLTITEAAKKMHVSRETVYAWIRSNKIKPVRTPGGRYRISEEQLTIPVERYSIYPTSATPYIGAFKVRKI